MILFTMSSSDLNYTAYNDKAQIYIDKNPGGTTGDLTPEQRVEEFQKYLKSGKVFEIGSGAGWDADALATAGFEVIASDYVPSFLDLLKSKSYKSLKFDGKNSSIPSDLIPLDGIYANAVFVHFNKEDFKIILKKIHSALRNGGYLYFSVMYGQGTEVAGRAKGIEREFWYYTPEVLRTLVEGLNYATDKVEYPIDEKWIHVICHKI